MCQNMVISMVKNMVIKDHILTHKIDHKYISTRPHFIIQKKKIVLNKLPKLYRLKNTIINQTFLKTRPSLIIN